MITVTLNEAEAREIRALLKSIATLPDDNVPERNRALHRTILRKLTRPLLKGVVA